MARFKFGRPISLRWNGLLIEGPAETVFEIPDEYYDEFDEDIGNVEPTLVWLDADEGETIRDRLDALEALGGGGGASLSNDNPVALGATAPGTGLTASRYDHVHPTTGLSLSTHNHAGVYDPAGTAATAISTHESASDPHPVYLTDAEGDAQYSQLGHTHTTAGYTTIIKQYVKNDGTAKSKGEAVYISSSDGTNPIVSYADADTEATSSKTLGLLEQDLTANEHGWVITEGVITNINTASATAGQSVWLSGTAGGRVYGAPPAEPAHGVYLGVVTKANASTGEIFVKVQNGYEFNELHDVSTGGAVNGDIIQYDGSMWNSKSLSTAGISTTSHNHTGTYANASHTHAESDVSSLISDLAGKSDTGHSHSGTYDPAGTAAAAVSTHAAVTTSVHGISNTADLVYTSDSRLSDARTPTAHKTTHATGGSDALSAADIGAATSGHSHSYVTSATGTTNQVNVSSSTGAVTFSLPQSIATTSTPTFANVTATNYFKSSASLPTPYSLGGSSTTTTGSSTVTNYVAVTSHEVSFTPDYVGQKFIVMFTGSAYTSTATLQYCLHRLDITDSSNTQVAVLAYNSSVNNGGTTINYAFPIAIMSTWTADSTSARKAKLYFRMQTTASVTLTSLYSNLSVVPVP